MNTSLNSHFLNDFLTENARDGPPEENTVKNKTMLKHVTAFLRHSLLTTFEETL